MSTPRRAAITVALTNSNELQAGEDKQGAKLSGIFLKARNQNRPTKTSRTLIINLRDRENNLWHTMKNSRSEAAW